VDTTVHHIVQLDTETLGLNVRSRFRFQFVGYYLTFLPSVQVVPRAINLIKIITIQIKQLLLIKIITKYILTTNID